MKSSNNTKIYIIVIVVIVVAFLLLGGGSWVNKMMYGNIYMGISHWSWTQILISLGIGFLLGWLIAKRR